MPLWNDPVNTNVNRLKDTLVFSVSGNHVSNYALDLLNRAQNYLQMLRQWDFLVKTSELTLSESYRVSLPSDINTILAVYVDVEGIGKPTVYYYKDAPDVAERYEVYDSFSVDTGHTWYLQFPSVSPVPGTLYVRYTYNLASIAANQTYTFFPSELLFRCAQKLHHEDKGTTGDSIEYTIRAYNEVLDSFIRNVQHANQKMDWGVKDRWGNPLKISGHTLNGGTAKKFFSPYQNSSILTG
jgi:hypothetical protein